MQALDTMGDKGETNRIRIIEAADQLVYQQGFANTSFSDIAEASGLSRGNFYYYFKTKDEILAAVIDFRTQGVREMLKQWSNDIPDPRKRLMRFTHILLNEQNNLLQYGCPMGSLNAELCKTGHAAKTKNAEMFDVFLEWLIEQFATLGFKDDARAKALHLMALGQGASVMSNVYSDAEFLQREVAIIEQWINSL